MGSPENFRTRPSPGNPTQKSLASSLDPDTHQTRPAELPAVKEVATLLKIPQK
jgi:hypothetical protein